MSLRPGDQLAGAAERRDHLVVAALRLQVGGDVVAVQRLHRVLLQAPDAVVAADHHDRQPVPDQGVDVHQREAGRAVAEQQHDLGGRPGHRAAIGVAKAGAQAAVRAGVEPAAWLPRLDVLARVADEVAAVADDDGVGLEQRARARRRSASGGSGTRRWQQPLGVGTAPRGGRAVRPACGSQSRVPTAVRQRRWSAPRWPARRRSRSGRRRPIRPARSAWRSVRPRRRGGRPGPAACRSCRRTRRSRAGSPAACRPRSPGRPRRARASAARVTSSRPGGQDAAPLAVGDHRQPQLLGRCPGGVLRAVEPDIRAEDQNGRRVALASSPAISAIVVRVRPDLPVPSVRGTGRTAGGPDLDQALARASRTAPPGSTSRKTGPRCAGAASVERVADRGADTAAGLCSVQARLVTGASRAGWSNSCRLPEPHR